MTPLEELQAAHKRLSELRASGANMSPAPWEVAPDGIVGTSDITSTRGAVAEFYRLADADLIITLHRTIDAQLAILDSGIEGISLVRKNSIAADAGSTWTVIALPLARAINGEAS